jgi:hypothetical protein
MFCASCTRATANGARSHGGVQDSLDRARRGWLARLPVDVLASDGVLIQDRNGSWLYRATGNAAAPLTYNRAPRTLAGRHGDEARCSPRMSAKAPLGSGCSHATR